MRYGAADPRYGADAAGADGVGSAGANAGGVVVALLLLLVLVLTARTHKNSGRSTSNLISI